MTVLKLYQRQLLILLHLNQFQSSSSLECSVHDTKWIIQESVFWRQWRKSIPTGGAQYVTLQKYFSHPSLVIYFFCNPTHKTETGTANKWELLIANHLGQSLWFVNQKQGAPVRSYLLHSSLSGSLPECFIHLAMIHIIEEDEVEWGVHLPHLLVKEELRCMVWLPTMWVPTLVFCSYCTHPIISWPRLDWWQWEFFYQSWCI